MTRIVVIKDLLGENTLGGDDLRGQLCIFLPWGQHSEVGMGKGRWVWEEVGRSVQVDDANSLGHMEIGCWGEEMGF